MHTLTDTIIDVKDVSFSYEGKKVLDTISIQVHKGDYLCLIGPNGGGKSTLVKLILGLLKPDKGTITFSRPLKLGYVSQTSLQFDKQFPLTVYDVVSLALDKTAKNRIPATRNTEITHALETVGIEKLSARRIGELSGGQQQRVFIARALVNSPDIIFLDEPTTGVDIENQEAFYKLLDSLHEKRQVTLVLVSHDVSHIAKRATEFACINRTLTYHGNPKSYITAHASADASQVSILPHSHA